MLSTEAQAPLEETPLISCERLVVGYHGKALLPAFDLHVNRGSFVVVVGRNGSGKSTWFKTLLGMQAPVSGAVVKGPGLRSAYVPQTSAIDSLLPLRAQEVVLWGRLNGWGFLRPFATRADRAATERAIATAGATAFAHRPYRELSEGQKQRILLARVLATEAELVLLDEPTAAMDAVAERETMERLSGLARGHRIGVVVVSHQLRVASEYADTVLFMDRVGPTVLVGDARTVFCHEAFIRQYGDDYCNHLNSGTHRGPGSH
ncbi:metal ABC transporter ATP-binding protein [Aggregicoccus sp. 17bor-14]|uniref:metal ABC transporter ATP-binding protein n=1 Tax=Myxococcaceae TaxID=31 RepID=UPI00129CBAB6|nr:MULTISPECIES: metal ABC transporter ATP-binding protein [Myxococcaceae]MBF5041280.1 metal ABC transporter ATP-binding protein [Simulacricoccus sp. 17bor-14]MRI87066.1 metal ABC transporter ATP-binding protein [Aggregicoccus sp. 17bor-14]